MNAEYAPSISSMATGFLAETGTVATILDWQLVGL